MRHGKAGFKLGRVTAHRWALFRNLLVALFRHERIMTTEAKAKAVRGLADQMVTLAKRDSLHARRQVLSMVPDTEVVKKLFDTIAARFGDRHGGYTRIMRAGTRPGAASLAGKRGIVKITPGQKASLAVAGNALVGLAFAPGKAAVLATASGVHHLSWGIQGKPLLE